MRPTFLTPAHATHVRYDAVTLDLYGTLLQFSIEEHEPPLVESLLCVIDSSLDADEVLAVWLEASMAERARLPFRTAREALRVGAQAVRERFAIALDPEDWTRALESLWSDRPFADGVPEALDALRAAGLRLALVTNLDRGVLDRVIARRGLDTWIDVFVTSEDARAYKPDPRPFEMALAQLGVPADRCLHIGNSAREDGAGAEGAGLDHILIAKGPRAFADAVGRLLADHSSPS